MIIKFLFYVVFIKASIALRRPVLLISMDGLQAGKFDEFVQENPNSYFSQFINNGLKSDYLTPSTPSYTFPNHFTLITGLYPESHGIVNNIIYDPKYNEKGKLTTSADIKWWNSSETIWYTAKKQGLKTASSFWVSNNVWPRQPDIFLAYDPNYDMFIRIDELINWYKKFDLDFACIYFDEPDITGHKYGPNSIEYKKKIAYMDSVFGYLLTELDKINKLNDLNIIILSDHGMAEMSNDQFIFIKDYVEPSLIDFNKSVFAIVSSIYPKSDDKLNELFEKMQRIPNHKVYLKNQVPEELHYSKNERIGPIVVFSNEGFRLMDENPTSINLGAHGFASDLTSMRAIFLAKGPNFKKGKLDGFSNVNVYPLLCKLLEIKCHSNNGSIEIFEPYLSSSIKSYGSFLSFFYVFISSVFFKILLL